MDYSKYLDKIRKTRSHNTYDSYAQALAKFPNGSYEDVINYIGDSEDADTTKKTRLGILKSALKWYGVLDDDIADEIRYFTPNKPIQPCPTDKQVESVWKTFYLHRDKLLFALLAYRGLRIGEALNIRLDDLFRNDDGDLAIRLLNTKGKRDNMADIDPAETRIIEELKLYLANERNDSKDDPYLFVTRYGTHMKTTYAKNLIKQACIDGGYPEFHAHSFRRYFANYLFESGCDIMVVKEALRHASIATTQIYMNIGRNKVKSALAAASKRRYQKKKKVS